MIIKKDIEIAAELPKTTLFKRSDGIYGLGKLMTDGKFWGIIIDNEKQIGQLIDLADDLKHNPVPYDS